MQPDPQLAVWERALLGDPEAVAQQERWRRLGDEIAAEEEPDILSRIDATVEAVESCGCGCGRRLDPTGPSPFFASDACQRRYHERHATDPGEVLNRPDAASVHPGADGLAVPLRVSDRPDLIADVLEAAVADVQRVMQDYGQTMADLNAAWEARPDPFSDADLQRLFRTLPSTHPRELRGSPDAVRRVAESAQPAPRRRPWEPGGVGDLFGIPVRVDPDMPADVLEFRGRTVASRVRFKPEPARLPWWRRISRAVGAQAWRVLDWLYPTARCPGHREWECLMCDWPDRRVVAAVHRGGGSA